MYQKKIIIKFWIPQRGEEIHLTYSESHSVNKEKKKKCYSGNMILLGKNMSSVTMEMLHSSEE